MILRGVFLVIIWARHTELISSRQPKALRCYDASVCDTYVRLCADQTLLRVSREPRLRTTPRLQRLLAPTARARNARGGGDVGREVGKLRGGREGGLGGREADGEVAE